VALGRERAESSGTYLLAGTMLAAVATANACLVVLLFPNATAALVFGDRSRDELVVPFVATLAATVLINLTIAYYRGRSDFKVGSAVRIFALALAPVALLVAFGDESISRLIMWIAVLTAAPCIAVLVVPFARALSGLGGVGRANVLVAAATLLDYGYRRIAGDIAAAALFAAPPILAAHAANLDGVAYLSAGLYMLSLMTVVFQPVGQVFLPLLSRLCATDFETARRHVQMLTAAAIQIALFITPQLVLFSSTVVRAWLGPSFVDAGTIITITVCPAGLFALSIIVRSALDAAAVKAYNSRNTLIALTAAAACVSAALAADVVDPVESIAASLVVGVTVLGVLTLISVHRLYRLHASAYALPASLALAGAATALALPVRFLVIRDETSLRAVTMVALLECALTAGYLSEISRAGATWPGAIRRRLPGFR
jgi:O-antigen/teichoic acid export membrane protein